MPKLTRNDLLVMVTGIAGAACLFVTLRGFAISDWTGIIFFTALACATQFWRIQVPTHAITVTFGMYFAMALLYGQAAVPLAMLANLAGMLIPKRGKLRGTVFNVANTGLALYATAWIIEFGQAMLGQPLIGYGVIYVLAPLVCFLINSSLVASAIATEWNVSYISVWRKNLRPIALNYLLLSPMGAVVARVYTSAGIAGVGVFIIPLLMARYSFRLYLDKTKEVEDGVKALRRYAEALEQVNAKLNQRVQELTALQEAGGAIGATLKLQQTLDQIIEIIGRALGFSFGLVAVFAEESSDIEFEIYHFHGDTRRINKRRCQEIVRSLAASSGEHTVPISECIDEAAGEEDTLYFLPLVDRGKNVGVIALSASSQAMAERLPALSVFRNQAATAITNARLYERAERMAITDGLTGLYNHRHFLELLDREFRSALRRQAPLSLLVTDIDSFKLVNDTYGHLAGDQLVREVAHELSAALRRTDVLARFGGDEFVIILPNTSQMQAVEVAEKVRRRIATRDFRIGSSGKIHTTISIGVAAYPEAAQTRQELVERADRAAYYSKQTGRNRASVYSPTMESVEVNALLRGKPTPEDYTIALHNMYVDAIRSLSYLVDAKDPYTYGHSTRVERLATELARAMRLPQEEVLTIQRAALLHDIGKVGISEQILHKRAPLQPDEWDAIKKHPAIGAQIIRGVSFLEAVIPLVYHHQERFDGSGYPAGLRGDNIPLGARIIALADAYEAMTSDRPYRAAKPAREALAELRRCAGSQFDPALVEAFVPLIQTQEPEIYDEAAVDG
ncbi:MAG: diguanylate cyclase [Chloroflexota bacterium]